MKVVPDKLQQSSLIAPELWRKKNLKKNSFAKWGTLYMLEMKPTEQNNELACRPEVSQVY